MARSFNGSTGKINATRTIAFNHDQTFSVGGWFRIDDNNYSALVSTLDTATSFRGWEISRNNSGLGSKFKFFLVNAYSGTALELSFVFTVTNSVWFHYLLTYNGNHLATGVAAYANGIPTGVSTTDFNTLGTNTTISTTAPIIGQRKDGTIPLNGRAADVAVWNAVLAPAEALALGTGIVRPWAMRPANLRACWPLDGYGGPAIDLGPYKNNGILTGTGLAAGPPLISSYRAPEILSLQRSFLMKKVSAPSFISGWSRQSNLPVIGGGTF